jgi:hypothetical protein
MLRAFLILLAMLSNNWAAALAEAGTPRSGMGNRSKDRPAFIEIAAFCSSPRSRTSLFSSNETTLLKPAAAQPDIASASQLQDFLDEDRPISRVGDHLTGSLAEPKATIVTRPFSCRQVCVPADQSGLQDQIGQLNPTGEGGFEALGAVLLTELTGTTFALAHSGPPGGKDGANLFDEGTVVIEAKLYEDDLPKDRVIAKIAEAATLAADTTELWIRGSTDLSPHVEVHLELD